MLVAGVTGVETRVVCLSIYHMERTVWENRLGEPRSDHNCGREGGRERERERERER